MLKEIPLRYPALLVLLASAAPAVAQWSSDASINLALADAGGDQVQSKIRTLPDGSSYVSWFDNQTGGYDVRLQRLSAGGVEQWAHGGVLLADRSYSSTVDYDLRVDAQGNALVAFNDDRVATDQITVVKVGAGGGVLWTVRVSSGSAFKANPHLCVLSDGAIAAGWTEGSGYRLQRLSPEGVPLLASPLNVVETGRSLTMNDLAPGLSGAVMVSYTRPTGGFNTPKHIYAQSYTSAGAAAWATPRAVFDGGSLQFGSFPPIVADGAGGAVFAWYNTGGTRPALVQHLRADGTEVFAHNGVALSTDTTLIHTDPSAAYDPATGVIYASWTVSNQLQSQWGWRAQAVSPAGARSWTDAGRQLLPLSANQKSFARAVADGHGMIASCFDARGPVSGVVLAAGVDEEGALRWSPATLEACSVVSGKSRLEAAWNGTTALLAWGDGRHDGGDIYIQNVNPDGTLGPSAPPCTADFNGDGFVDFFDYDDFVSCFETGACPPGRTADVNGDDFVDFFDYDDFVTQFEAGC